jgi:tRNA1Val (adenine37-N6)-methyltransferase
MLSHDSLLGGRLTVRQPRRGYRFSIDALLLAAHCRPKPRQRIIDLGTGCGVVAMLLAWRHPHVTLCGVELQPELAAAAMANVRDNALEQRVKIVTGDMLAFRGEGFPVPVEWVVSNPPYRVLRSGKLNPDSQRAVARHEIRITLAQVAATAARLLKLGGRFVTIIPCERLADLMVALRSVSLEPKRLRLVHSRREQPARLALVEAVSGAGSGVQVAAPLVIYAAEGGYTPEVASLLAP